ncbi:hypothetical protein KUTeg_013098 [Tegillarca granosa]|uniref:UNC93-like protein MFSD11 n=1 Tax=Tegillarca granosa TaxID=220873 RepID=A0ABQ9ESP8_TEGGR|nr:hypothetical protein KUTeg_013098 [Tegillarca granosa]
MVVVISTAQGKLFTDNSDERTASRNSGIFFGMFQSSLLFGSLYSYFMLRNQSTIDESSRIKLYGGLSAGAFVAVITFLFLRKIPNLRMEEMSEVGTNTRYNNVCLKSLDGLKDSFMLLKSKEMLIFSVVAIYAGLELTFYSGVYGTCIAQNKHFGQGAKGFIGLSGIFIGIGELTGSALVGIFWNILNKLGRDPVIMIGYLTHVTCFYLIFLNFPGDSPIKDTSAPTYITSNIAIAMLCSFLLGFGDSCLNTQIFSILSTLFKRNSSSAFAMFGFVRSIASSAAFYYSGYLLLHWQLFIMVVVGTCGTFCYIYLEINCARNYRLGYEEI